MQKAVVCACVVVNVAEASIIIVAHKTDMRSTNFSGCVGVDVAVGKHNLASSIGERDRAVGCWIFGG